MRHTRIVAISSSLTVLAAGVVGDEVSQKQQQQLQQLQQQKPLAHITTPLQRTSSAGQFLSCQETYGDDWTVCGDPSGSRFCYNPMIGQSCCEVDNGFCEEGTWCAPVAGYCCLDSEDLETCARNAGFEIPADLFKAGMRRPKHWGKTEMKALRRDIDASQKSIEGVLEDVESLRPAAVGRILVQESVAAGRERGTLTWMALGIGAVGLSMLCC